MIKAGLGVGEIKRYLSIFHSIFKCCLMSEMEYRTNFVLRMTVEISCLITQLAFFKLIYLNVDSIGGWTYNEMLVLVLYAWILNASITLLFSPGLSSIPKMINDGSMDFILLKPINKRFYLSCNRFETSQLGNILLFSIFCLGILRKSGMDISLHTTILFVLLAFCSLIIMYSIYFLIMIASFWTVKMDGAVSMFFQLFYVGAKPMEIFPNVIKFGLTFIIPIFIALNFPVKALFYRLEIESVFICFIVTLLLYIITEFIFRKALKKYSSTGT